jgi:hypothetical protein
LYTTRQDENHPEPFCLADLRTWNYCAKYLRTRPGVVRGESGCSSFLIVFRRGYFRRSSVDSSSSPSAAFFVVALSRSLLLFFKNALLIVSFRNLATLIGDMQSVVRSFAHQI